MEIFELIFKPFDWAVDIFMQESLKIANVPVWVLVLASMIMGFTIAGIIKNIGAISLPAPEEEPPNETVYYTTTRRVGTKNYGQNKVPVYEHRRYREYD